MMRRVMVAALVAAFGTATAGMANAATTLHGFCSTSDPSCADNGTNTPTSVNPPEFGFSAGGQSATGDVLIDILVPDDVKSPTSLSYTISGKFLGTSTFTADLVSKTAWTSGQLDKYLGLSASPSHDIGSYLPSTQTYQPTADGFYVFEANIGTRMLPSNSGAGDSDLMTTSQGLVLGSYIVAFIKQGDKVGTNSNSGAILETGIPTGGVPEPATWAMLILGVGMVGGVLRRRGRIASTVTAA